MTILSAYQFEIRPPSDQTSRQCLAAIRDKIVTWVQLGGRQFGISGLQFPFDGSCVTSRSGHCVTSDHSKCETHELVTLEWDFPSAPSRGEFQSRSRNGRTDRQPLPEDVPCPRFAWGITCGVACDERVVEVALLLRVVPESFVLWPLRIQVGKSGLFRPFLGLAAGLIREWSCWIEGEPVPTTATLLDAQGVEPFVRQTLLSPARILPVVLLGPGDRLLSQLSRAAAEELLERVQGELLGLAHVAGLRNEAAAARLTELVGRELSCASEGMRLYWPKFMLQSPPAAHVMYQTPKDPMGLVGPIHQQLAGMSGNLFEEGRVIRAATDALLLVRAEERRAADNAAKRLLAAETARRQLQEERDAAKQHARKLQCELADVRSQLKALGEASGAALPAERQAELDEIATGWEQAVGENRSLRTELETVQQRLGELEDDLRLAHDNLIWAWQTQDNDGALPAAAADEPVEDAIGCVADALRTAADEFPNMLSVWEDAFSSAEQSRFASPVQVLRALRAIAEVGQAYFAAREGGPPLGPVEHAISARVPFKYCGFESETTLRLFGRERVFRHADQSRKMQRHLTLGGGQTNHCLQIYFEFDDETRRVLIGYCGRHLPFCRQRT